MTAAKSVMTPIPEEKKRDKKSVKAPKKSKLIRGATAVLGLGMMAVA